MEFIDLRINCGFFVPRMCLRALPGGLTRVRCGVGNKIDYAPIVARPVLGPREARSSRLRDNTMQSMTRRLIQMLIVFLGFASSWSVQAAEGAAEPIVGLWLITYSYQGSVVDYVYSGWTSDGLEFDQDIASPMLTGYVCYGTWIKVGDHKYALTHPYFDYNAGTITALPFNTINLGTWDGTSGYFQYVLTVSEDGTTFTGVVNGTSEVPGPDPYVGAVREPVTVTLSARKIEVNRSLLPQP